MLQGLEEKQKTEARLAEDQKLKNEQNEQKTWDLQSRVEKLEQLFIHQKYENLKAAKLAHKIFE